MGCTDKTTNRYDNSKGAKQANGNGAGLDTLYETLASNQFFKWVPVIALIISVISLYKK